MARTKNTAIIPASEPADAFPAPVQEVGQGVYLKVDPDALDMNDSMNGRHYPAEIDSMKRDILQRGQLQPVAVRRLEDGRLAVAYGFRRANAVRSINADRGQGAEKLLLDVKVVDVDGRKAFLDNIQENTERHELSPIDHAHNISRLIDEFGMTKRAIAEELGKSLGWVSETHSLLKLSEGEQRMVHDGTIPVSQAHELAKMPSEARQPLVEQYRHLKDGGEPPTVTEVKNARVQEPPTAESVDYEAVTEDSNESTKPDVHTVNTIEPERPSRNGQVLQVGRTKTGKSRKGESTDDPRNQERPSAALRDFLVAQLRSETVPATVRDLCQSLLNFIDGTATDGQLRDALCSACGAGVQLPDAPSDPDRMDSTASA